jgi:hypothetical protein
MYRLDDEIKIQRRSLEREAIRQKRELEKSKKLLEKKEKRKR